MDVGTCRPLWKNTLWGVGWRQPCAAEAQVSRISYQSIKHYSRWFEWLIPPPCLKLISETTWKKAQISLKKSITPNHDHNGWSYIISELSLSSSPDSCTSEQFCPSFSSYSLAFVNKWQKRFGFHPVELFSYLLTSCWHLIWMLTMLTWMHQTNTRYVNQWDLELLVGRFSLTLERTRLVFPPIFSHFAILW